MKQRKQMTLRNTGLLLSRITYSLVENILQKKGSFRYTLSNGDVMSIQNGFFGAPPSPVVYRFPKMRDLGERLRQETIKQSSAS